MVGRLEQAGQEYNMLINSTKTKILTTADEQITVTVGGSVLEQVDTFCYLGSMIHNDARSVTEVKARLAMGMNVMTKLTKLWKTRCWQLTCKFLT